MTYEKQWGTTHPGCLILLLDQSGSMNDPFGGNQIGANRAKQDMVATVLNNLLNEFVKSNTVGSDIRRRADVAVLGYYEKTVESVLGSNPQGFLSLPELMDATIEIETRTRKEMDDTGNVIELPVYFPIWVKPKATGGTPMCAALHRAKELATQWVQAHPDNYPPVVINITDGMATDGDITIAAQELRQIRTSDGSTLLFNCHITDKNDREVQFPATEGDIPNDDFAPLLFSISDRIPESARANIQNQVGEVLPAGARGFIFNGDANSVRQMFVFATVGASQALNPNR